jgi:hypothetical protein
MSYQSLADLVLALHFAIVVFNVGGLGLILVGNWLGWDWVNHWWFRSLHLGAIAIVVVQSWLGQLCPLTTLESWLRIRAGQMGYEESFIEHWLHRALFFDAPFWVFTLIYTLFGALVIWVWWAYPPNRQRRR